MKGRPEKAPMKEEALEAGNNPSFVEKDWYVTQAIRTIAAIQLPAFTFVFTGGTALSKAHKLIQRFSYPK